MKIVVLMYKDNIVGRELLLRLGESGVNVSGILVEESKRSERDRDYLRNDFYNPSSFDEILSAYPSEVVTVQETNGDLAVETLERWSPDIILLDGSAIIKRRVIDTARIGALNAHPGLLPEYRGLDAVVWALSDGGEVGVTVHFVDEGIDTGPILIRREVPPLKGEELLSLRIRVMQAGVTFMLEAARGLEEGTLKAISQVEEGACYRSLAPPEVRKKAEEALSA